MRKYTIAILIFSAFINRAFAQHYTVTSPDKYEHKTITLNRQNRLDLKLMQGGRGGCYLHTK